MRSSMSTTRPCSATPGHGCWDTGWLRPDARDAGETDLRGGRNRATTAQELFRVVPETAWRKIMPGLAKKFTVIAPDTRGTGRSSLADGFSLEDVADDIYELIQSLGYTKVCLVVEQSAYKKSCPDPAGAALVSDVPVDVRLRKGFFAEDEVSKGEGAEELFLLSGHQQLGKDHRRSAAVAPRHSVG